MCTLSVGRHDGRWIFTHNRDETVQRGLAVAPSTHQTARGRSYWPTDPLGGGTWWAASEAGDAVFLLNGGFTLHQRTPPYKHSRGLVIPAMFECTKLDQFLRQFSFTGLEPFTLVGCYDRILFYWVWDGDRLHQHRLDSIDWQIWASSTLYPNEWKERRVEWLRNFLKTHANADEMDLWNFHHGSYTEERAYDMLMQRWGHLRTVAVSQVVLDAKKVHIRYEDRERGEEHRYSL